MDPHGEILPRLQGEACGAGSQREGLEGCGSKNKGEEAGRRQDKGKKDEIHELSGTTWIRHQSCSGPSWQAAPSLAASSLPCSGSRVSLLGQGAFSSAEFSRGWVPLWVSYERSQNSLASASRLFLYLSRLFLYLSRPSFWA